MTFTVRDTQARLAALGFDPGPIDGLRGANTNAALREALDEIGGKVAADLFGVERLHRIHWHWTAGAYGPIRVEIKAYNGLVDQHGNRFDGKHRFEAQARYQVGRAASHTLNGNTGAIGLAADAMAGAQERPFEVGSAPMTEAQLWELCAWTAELCALYWIPISPYSTLSHAEVQPTLGIRQRWKWDIRWLPGMESVGDARAVGNRLRAMTAEKAQDLELDVPVAA